MPLTAIFGDVHLNAEDCLEVEFKEALKSVAEEADLILFNGDFLDSYDENARNALKEFLEWAERKEWKEKMIFITGGMGHEGNILFDQPDIQVLPWAILNTKEGRIIVCHGHNIGLKKQMNETWNNVTSNLKKQLVEKPLDFLPEILSSDKLVISHIHTPFYDMENGVFATGAWKIKEKFKKNKEYIKRNVGVFIVIKEEERNDPIKLKRWFEKKIR